MIESKNIQVGGGEQLLGRWFRNIPATENCEKTVVQALAIHIFVQGYELNTAQNGAMSHESQQCILAHEEFCCRRFSCLRDGLCQGFHGNSEVTRAGQSVLSGIGTDRPARQPAALAHPVPGGHARRVPAGHAMT